MTYTSADFDAMQSKQLDAVRAEFVAVGISATGWSKMRVSDKREWLKDHLGEFLSAVSPSPVEVEISSVLPLAEPSVDMFYRAGIPIAEQQRRIAAAEAKRARRAERNRRMMGVR